MNHCMLDLETLSTRPGGVILSIGAVMFDSTGLGNKFYAVLSTLSQEQLGMHTDPATLIWWEKQSDAAKAVLRESTLLKAGHSHTLNMFNQFWQTNGARYLWCNGANFDDPMLTALYVASGVTPPWHYTNVRCYRTLKALAPHIKAPGRRGTYHNALNDAETQAEHAVLLLRAQGVAPTQYDPRKYEAMAEQEEPRTTDQGAAVDEVSTFTNKFRAIFKGLNK